MSRNCADRFLITFLRDPVERVISTYHFLRSDSLVAKYSQRAISAARSMTLSEFLRCEDPGVRMMTENFQAKALAFDIRPEYQSAIGDLYSEAASNLSTFDFVGIVEYFDESMIALSRAIGREVPIKNLNVTAARSSAKPIDTADLELIRQLNSVDVALYSAAKAGFEETVLPMFRKWAHLPTMSCWRPTGRRRSSEGFEDLCIAGSMATAEACGVAEWMQPMPAT
jgi:hypothetical protein